MRSLIYTAFLLCSALTLSGCIDRDEANAKLYVGCQAAADHLTRPPFKVEKVQNPVFAEVEFGQDTGLREVKMAVTETDGWLSRDKTYTCVFTEFLGFFNMSHKAELYRVEIGNTVLGKGEGANAATDRWVPLMKHVKAEMKKVSK